MPIYVMHCLDCGKITEQFFPTVDVSKWKCECGSDKYEKLIVRTSFRLYNDKCTGFTNNSSKESGG